MTREGSWRSDERSHLFERAVEAESRDPLEALTLYRRVDAANTASYPSILVTAVVAPVLAAWVAYAAAPELPVDRGLATVVIMLVLGYLPAGYLWGRRADIAHRNQYAPAGDRAFWTLVASIMFMIDSVAFVLSTVFYTITPLVLLIVVSGPIFHVVAGTPWWEPPAEFTGPAVAAALVISGLVVASDATEYIGLRLIVAPRRAIKEILFGLRVNASDNLGLLGGFGVGAFLVGSGPLGLLFEDLRLSLIAAALSGLLLGLGLWRVERAADWTILAKLGFVRCELLRGREVAAHWWIGHLQSSPEHLTGDCGRRVIRELQLLVGWWGAGDEDGLDEACDEIAEGLDTAQRSARALPLASQWEASVGASRRLLEALRAEEPRRRRSGPQGTSIVKGTSALRSDDGVVLAVNEEEAMPTSGEPAGMIAVASLPVGAVAFAIPAVTSVGEVKIDKITKRRHRLGKTPIRKEMAPGRYFVAVTHAADEMPWEARHHPNRDAFPSATSRVLLMAVEQPSDLLASITKLYEVSVRAGHTTNIVSLALPVPADEQRLPRPRLYPTRPMAAGLLDTCKVKPAHLTNAIRDNVEQLGLTESVGEDLVADMVAIARRVGKVGLFTDRKNLALQISDKGFEIMVYSVAAT